MSSNSGRVFTRRIFIKSTAMQAAAMATGAHLAWGKDAKTPGRLLAGAATTDITPPLGVSLSGPISKRGPSKRIITPLNTRALVLDNGCERIAFVVCDSTIIYDDVIKKAQRMVREQTGLPPERISISATHSHTVPRVGLLKSEVDQRYYDLVSRKIAEAVSIAVRNLVPAKVGWGAGSKPEYPYCRRKLIEPGSRINPFGETTDRAWMGGWGQGNDRPTSPVDPQVGVLSLRHTDGRPMAVLASYSIHYVPGDTRGDVTADYFGHFADRLAVLMNGDKADPPFVGMMANSNSGDTNGPGGGYKMQEKVGAALAEEVFRVCREIEYHDRVLLAVCHSDLELGVRRPDKKRIAWAKSVNAGTYKGKKHGWTTVYADQTLQLAEFPPTIPVRLQAFRIGELGITTNPCEMYASTALKIRAASPLKPCFNIELANGYRGYLPPPEQHKLGGYTTWPATSSYLEIDAEPKIRRELLRLLAQVKYL
ncbi:MAG: hypothetical protein JXM70_30570 [Pirellulales bacterium]|nr:hypothetical protein [Pirellulales bacterium]